MYQRVTLTCMQHALLHRMLVALYALARVMPRHPYAAWLQLLWGTLCSGTIYALSCIMSLCSVCIRARYALVWDMHCCVLYTDRCWHTTHASTWPALACNMSWVQYAQAALHAGTGVCPCRGAGAGAELHRSVVSQRCTNPAMTPDRWCSSSGQNATRIPQ